VEYLQNQKLPYHKPAQAILIQNLKVSPTTAEISQSSATDADGSSTSVKTKRKGRSATILTSSAGVEGDATLGKKSLLGE
jgi:hypothetical protein